MGFFSLVGQNKCLETIGWNTEICEEFNYPHDNVMRAGKVIKHEVYM